MNVDDLDLQILKELRLDCRQSYRKIAGKLKVATGTVQNRINKMEKDGIIGKYHVDISYGKLGYGISAIIGICVDRQNLDDIQKVFKKNPNVFGMYDVTGEYDIFISVRFKDMNELNEFIKKDLCNQYISKTVTFLVLRTLKEAHTFLSK